MKSSSSAMDGGSIRLVNHASLLIRSGDSSLLTDPWFSGSIFDEGWSLLHVNPDDSIAQIAPTSIWISHEHPDHFHPSTLRQVPKSQRAETPIYFRKTKDRRVRDWCESNGFPVIECEPEETYYIGKNIELRVFPVGIVDSAAVIYYDGKTFLNLNDCNFLNPPDLKRFLRNLNSEIDYVGYLCGYAEGGGSRVDNSFRKRLMTMQAERFKWLLDALPNSKILGFAAFKYFSHKENFFQNDSISFDFLRDLVLESPRVIVLKPGDRLETASKANSLVAIDFWEEKRRVVSPTSKPIVPIDEDAIVRLARHMNARFRQAAGLLGIAMFRVPKYVGLRPLIFDVVDLEKRLVLDPRLQAEPHLTDLKEPLLELNQIRLSSGALQYSLRDPYGLATLLINGRFEASDSARANLYKWAMVGLVSLSDQRIDLRFVFSNLRKILSSVKN